ncbi:MAG: hypothetical protein H6624_02390 [Bdellovibrionaceae bacterium]|nr:hypothetical protein [Bdellovibrionales bacterium]MCB9083160.1 hypothetical protein [Pseudobdellovibrionaceae bacterium]
MAGLQDLHREPVNIPSLGPEYWRWLSALLLLLFFFSLFIPQRAQAFLDIPLPKYVSRDGLKYPEALIRKIEQSSIPPGAITPQMIYQLNFPIYEFNEGSAPLRLIISPMLLVRSQLPACMAEVRIDRESMLGGFFWSQMGKGHQVLYDTDHYTPEMNLFFSQAMGSDMGTRGLKCQNGNAQMVIKKDPKRILNFLLPLADEKGRAELWDAYYRDHGIVPRLRLVGDPPEPLVIQSALPSELKVEWTSYNPFQAGVEIKIPAWRDGYQHIQVGPQTRLCYQKQIDALSKQIRNFLARSLWAPKADGTPYDFSVRIDLSMSASLEEQDQFVEGLDYIYLDGFGDKPAERIPVVNFSLGPGGCRIVEDLGFPFNKVLRDHITSTN